MHMLVVMVLVYGYALLGYKVDTSWTQVTYMLQDYIVARADGPC